MRIRRIELEGFKSFVDRTVFQLAPGICCVVGPNGSGKSNIIDAIKWTLGEQSATTLRGKAMEDVIFSGSEDRRPAARAEVALVFDNADGRFGGRYARFDEVQVSRRLDRNGRSDYSINKTPARLKDIVELFLDSGVGARGYSIIEQGRVGFVVNSKSDERRVLIDEVAGINKFKAQRAESERRMHRTRENLLRVRDLLNEMGRQRSSLQRAARKARKYRDLRAEWKAESLKALAGQALVEAQRLQSGEQQVEETTAGEGDLQRRLEEARVELRERDAAARELHARFESLTRQRAEAASTLTLRQREHQFRSEERKGIGARLERINADVSDMGGRSREVARGIAAARDELTRAREGLQRLEREVEAAGQAEEQLRATARDQRAAVEALKARALEARTSAARASSLAEALSTQIVQGEASLADHDAEDRDHADDLRALEARAAAAVTSSEVRAAAYAAAQQEAAEADARLQAARDAEAQQTRLREACRNALAEARARHASLQELLDGLAGFGDGVRDFLAAHRDHPGVLGPVAELLDVPAGRESDVEAALGPLLQGIVVTADALDGFASAVEAQDLERIALVVADPSRPRTHLAAAVDERVPGLAAVLLGDVDRTGAPRTVTGTGQLHSDGVVWVGRHTGSGEGVLARRRQASDLAEQVDSAQAALTEAEASVARSSTDAAACRAARDAARARVHEAELLSLEGRRDLDESRRAVVRATTDRERRAAQRAQLVRRLEVQRGEVRASSARATELDAQGAAFEAEAAASRGGMDGAEQAVADAAARANALRVEHAALQQAAAGRLRDVRRLDAEASDLERRLTRAESDRKGADAREAQLQADLQRLAEQATALEGEGSRLAEEVAAADAARTQGAAARASAEAATERLQQELEALRGARMKREVGLAEARAGLQALADRAATEFDVQLGELLEAVGSDTPPTVDFRGDGSLELLPEHLDPQAIDAHRRAAGALQKKLEAIGPVNLAAPDEFDEVDARFQEVQGQSEDLEKALRDLQSAIARIEKETRDRFAEAFEAVAARFSLLYPRLVGGGRAELKMTDPKAPLTTGVDVSVEPPGKRLQNLTLLSGGEKAMAAIALVFAIFQVKPSPFCLLDEVDAPLDEANSRRFNDTLREMAAETQFVVITHNRTTMEVADVLYGVTMQKAGVSSLVSVKLDALSQDP